ncbi:MAG: reverse transcriptase family protein [bacterium]|nr:reverse transcriptase family protein [bacterium]
MAKLKSLNRLCRILEIDKDDLLHIVNNKSVHTFYKCKKEGFKCRRIDEPRGDLKIVQKKIHSRILKPEVQKMPEIVMGYRGGGDSVINAKIHQGAKEMLKYDFENFFPSISSDRIRYVFRYELGFTAYVANLLTYLCTNNEGVLAQGMPTSSSLAILATKKMAIRLGEYAKENNINISIYVDDITISSRRRGELSRLKGGIESVIKSTKLPINNMKSGKIIKKGQPGFSVTGITITRDNKLSIGRRKKSKMRLINRVVNRGNKTKKMVMSRDGLINYEKRVKKLSSLLIEK